MKNNIAFYVKTSKIYYGINYKRLLRNSLNCIIFKLMVTQWIEIRKWINPESDDILTACCRHSIIWNESFLLYNFKLMNNILLTNMLLYMYEIQVNLKQTPSL